MKKYLLILLLLSGVAEICSAQTLSLVSEEIGGCSGGVTTIRTTVFYASNCVWQYSPNSGGNWYTITDNATYSSGGSSVLTINMDFSLNGNEYQVYFASSPSTPSDIAQLFIIQPPTTPVFISPVTSVCQGATVPFSIGAASSGSFDSLFWTYSGDNSFSVYPPTSLINDSAVFAHFSVTAQSGTLTVTSKGYCPYTASVSTPITVNSLQSTPAAIAGGGPVCESSSVIPGVATTYSDGTCNPIAAVSPSGASPVSGIVQSCVTVDASVQSFNGLPYVQRHYSLEPATNASTATATVTLYYTQADFDAYNLARGSSPALPTGPSDATGIGNIHITQFHGTGTTPSTYAGGSGDIIPATVWNSTASRWELTFDITGFSGFFASGGSIVPLPLTLTSFTGTATATGNLLQWETAMEENTSYFEVQRADAGGNFEPLATVSAAGNSDQPLSYSYTDPFAGTAVPSYSYRLKMADLDGKFTYSKIVTLQASLSGLAVRISPNPFHHQPVSIIVTAPEAAQGTLTVTDISGKKLLVQAISLQAGDNSQDPALVATLPQGVYFLSIITDHEKQTVKFIKD